MQLEAAIKELELICQRSRKLSISFLLLMSVKTTLTAMMASFAMVLRYAIWERRESVSVIMALQ